jgi:hypothetical protein
MRIIGVHGVGQGRTNEIRLAYDRGKAITPSPGRRPDAARAVVPTLTVPHYTTSQDWNPFDSSTDFSVPSSSTGPG